LKIDQSECSVSYRSAPKKQHLCSTSLWTKVFKAILTFAVDYFELPIGMKAIITCKGLWNFKTMFTTILCRSSSISASTLGRGVHYYVLRKCCYFSCRFVKK
jgi:hypothetical protein